MASECREQDCKLELRNPQMWLAPGGAALWFLGIELAPHSWVKGQGRTEIKTQITEYKKGKRTMRKEKYKWVQDGVA